METGQETEAIGGQVNPETAAGVPAVATRTVDTEPGRSYRLWTRYSWETWSTRPSREQAAGSG